jgi:cyclopropane fatty-acyl-phospholipid synthase-like methyltransferase
MRNRSYIYGIVLSLWRVLPKRLRSLDAFGTVKKRVASGFRDYKQGIYTAEYYAKDVETAARESAGQIVGSICLECSPRNVVDLGCGTGALLEIFASQGVTVFGLEYSDAGCRLTQEKGVPVQQFDVRFDQINPAWGRFDVVCCTEVAEHIPEEYATKLVESLTQLGRYVVFTAATPGQGGTDHVNEQPHDYWIAMFRERNFHFCDDLTECWAVRWKESGVADWYWKNLLVFRENVN